MGGLLNSAFKFFQPRGAAPASRAQRYSVACAQGHRLTGLRTEGYQALRCPTCGDGIFVLPRSPLPDPTDERGSSSRPRSRSSVPAHDEDDAPIALRDPDAVPDDEPQPEDAIDGEVIWEDEAPASPPNLTPVGSPEDLAAEEIAQASQASRPRQATRPKPGPKAKADESKGHVARVVEPRPRLADRLRARRNPLIFGGVLVIVAATVGFRLWRARIADLPRVAELGRTEGLTALDEGKFERAHQILSNARRAVESLSGEVEGASAIVQGADEASVIVNLVSESLESLLDQASRAESKAWESTFNELYAGRTVILDDFIRATPDGRGNGSYELEYEILPMSEGGKPRTRGRIDLTGFRLFELTKPRVGDHVSFGAQLKSFRYDLDRERWLVGLVPESGVQMTHARALEALGIAPDTDAAAEEAQP